MLSWQIRVALVPLRLCQVLPRRIATRRISVLPRRGDHIYAACAEVDWYPPQEAGGHEV